MAAVAAARSVRSEVSADEWSCRVTLAAAYRLMDHAGVRDLTYNHLSSRVPGEPDAIRVVSRKPVAHNVASACGFFGSNTFVARLAATRCGK